jgi:hypothetical protein
LERESNSIAISALRSALEKALLLTGVELIDIGLHTMANKEFNGSAAHNAMQTETRPIQTTAMCEQEFGAAAN